jgi:hypothetical protein
MHMGKAASIRMFILDTSERVSKKFYISVCCRESVLSVHINSINPNQTFSASAEQNNLTDNNIK